MASNKATNTAKKKNNTKQPQTTSQKAREKAFEEKTAKFFNGGMKGIVTAYMLALLTIFPLLTFDRFDAMGDIKTYSFYVIAIVFIPVFFLMLVFKAYGRKPEFPTFTLSPGNKGPVISIWLPVILLLIVEVIVFLCSYNKQLAFFGYPTWNVGFLMSLLVITTYIVFLIARGFQNSPDEALMPLLGIGAIVSFFFGFLRVFGIIYPEGSDAWAGISTFGNSNWYCGFISVFLPFLIAGLFLSLPLWKKIVLHASLFISLLTTFTNPSDSIFLSVVVIFIAVFLLGLAGKFETFIEFGLNLSFASVICAIIKGVSLTISYSTIKMRVFGNPVIAIALVIIFTLLFALNRKGKLTKFSHPLIPEKLISYVPLIIIIGIVVILIFQLSATLSPTAISGRGATWNISGDLYKEMPFGRKLIGCGQDNMGFYIQSVPEINTAMQEQWNTDVLSNAHSSILTILIDKGLIGLSAFLFFIYANMKSATQTLIKKNEDGSIKISFTSTVVLLTAVSYIANSMVSFDNACNLPLLYMFMVP